MPSREALDPHASHEDDNGFQGVLTNTSKWLIYQALMPTMMKDLAVDQEQFRFSRVENVVALFCPITAINDTITKFFAPKAFAAKNDFEERKLRERNKRMWLENIVKQKTQLQQNQAELRAKIDNRKNTAGVGI